MAMAEPSIIPNVEIDDGRDPAVREFIDNTLVALVHGLTSHPPEALSITLKCRARQTPHIINPISRALEATPRVETHKTYSWPGKTPHEAWRFGREFPPTTLGVPFWVETDISWVYSQPLSFRY
jgi:meiotic recombination protein SPO11